MSSPTREDFLLEMERLFDYNTPTAYQFYKAVRENNPRTAPTVANVTDIEERKQLWHEVHDMTVARGISLQNVSFAVFLICPLDRLRAVVERIMASSPSSQVHGKMVMALDTLRFFLAKGQGAAATTPLTETASVGDAEPASGPSNPKRKATGSPPGTHPAKKSTGDHPPPSLPVMHSPTSADRRKRSAVNAVYQRDQHKCILTGYGFPDAVHIFPFSGNKDTIPRNWVLEFLESFWGLEATAVWRAKCQDAGVTESPQNILCLNKHMHALWRSARFGLKPLRNERAVARNEVWVQFHWLRQGPLKPGDAVSPEAPDELMDVLAGRNAERSDGFATGGSHNSSRGCNSTLAHRESGILIQTGQVFVVRAQDPSDLPSLDLLELQWHLVRLAAMSGAADEFDENGKYDRNPSGSAMRDLLRIRGYYDSDPDELEMAEDDIESLDLEDTATPGTAF